MGTVNGSAGRAGALPVYRFAGSGSAIRFSMTSSARTQRLLGLCDRMIMARGPATGVLGAILGHRHRVPLRDDETAKTLEKRAGLFGYVYGYLYE
jgi:hypothetical protein